MRILIETVGSAGDVHPFVGVGRALVERGHDVALFSNEHFRGVVEAAGLRFVPTGPAANYEEITADPDLWHPTRGPFVVLGNTVRHLLAPTVDALLGESRGADTVIVSPTLGFAGRCAAELAGVPLVRAHLQPVAFRSLHSAPRLPGMWMPDATPRWWKRVLYRLSDLVVDGIVCEHLNTLRVVRGLPEAHRVFDRWIHEADLLLALYPEWLAPPQPDAPEGLQHTGFVLFDRAEQQPLGDDLAQWLADGDPPVLCTHGSANRHGRRFFEAAAAAANALGRRALLVTTEPRDVAGLTGGRVRHETYVPFGAALPRTVAFVHHGGIGTTAQGLAAGVPQLAVPLGFDQPDNAARIERLGVGRSVPARRFSPRAATAALRALLDDADHRSAAARAADRLRSEGDAASRAAELILGAAADYSVLASSSRRFT